MKETIKKEGIEWIKAFAIGIIIFILIRTFFFSNYVVEGVSMEPTLESGNKLIVNKIGNEIGDFQRFDVIVFHHDEDEDFVKRIIGLPGDKIEYRNDELYINGEKVNEPYLEKYREDYQKESLGSMLTADFTLMETTGVETVPEGKVFVLGDNRPKSWDSRHYGLVSIDQIVGKVNLRYWPIDEMDISF